jgi:hypothetical protein
MELDGEAVWVSQHEDIMKWLKAGGLLERPGRPCHGKRRHCPKKKLNLTLLNLPESENSDNDSISL